MTYASGENFTIEIEGGVAVCRLFKRAELEPAVLATSYAALAKHARELCLHNDVNGIVLDLRRLPGAVGPQVEALYSEVARRWEATAQRIAFLVLSDPIQKLQVVRVTLEAAPRFGAVFTDRNDARAFVGGSASSDADPPSRVGERLSRVR